MRARAVELRERIECPILGIIALLMLVGITKRPGLEVSPALELWVIADLRSPLTKEVSRARPGEETRNTNAANAVVISPCLATGGPQQQVSFKRRLAVDACQLV